MSRIKNDISILYMIGGFELPFPVTINQMSWAVVVFFAVLFFQKLPPLSWIDNPLLKYLVLPLVITWFMSRKVFSRKMLNHLANIIKIIRMQTVLRLERTRKCIFYKPDDDVAAYKKDIEERKKNAWAAWEREQKGVL